MSICLPLVEELPIAPDLEAAFLRLSRLPHVLFLDSALRDPQLGRYSFLSADPFAFCESPAQGDPFARLQLQLAPFRSEAVPDLPPFQGGAAGLFGYSLGSCLERLPASRFDEFPTPALAMGLYDVVLAIDHVRGRAWLISQGFPASSPEARNERATARLSQFRSWLLEGERADVQRLANQANVLRSNTATWPGRSATGRPEHGLAPAFATPGPDGLLSNFSRAGYVAAVQRAVDYIEAGDIFQVNLSQRLLFPAHDDSVALYVRLRQRNPAPFAGYFDAGEFQIASASPERFVQLRGTQVETRPIKGTRQRTARPEADLYAADELRQSEKDRAENVMIVDLMRNDLARVCRPESVTVAQLCQLEVYQFVQHLVSSVRGELADGRTSFDLLRAVFPGGSVTGAPKVRAMEIIAELEPTARGPYCGALGYLGFDGSVDLNILIRTITAGCGWWQLPVGGGIVAQSDPRQEYEETWHKATGLVRALTP